MGEHGSTPLWQHIPSSHGPSSSPSTPHHVKSPSQSQPQPNIRVDYSRSHFDSVFGARGNDSSQKPFGEF